MKKIYLALRFPAVLPEEVFNSHTSKAPSLAGQYYNLKGNFKTSAHYGY
jgi:hypothetical protein